LVVQDTSDVQRRFADTLLQASSCFGLDKRMILGVMMMTNITSRPILASLTLAIAAATLVGCGTSNSADKPAANAQAAPPPPEVVVVVAQSAPVTRQIELAGRLRAYEVAEVRPQATGIIQERLFVEGAQVRAGDALYRLDRAPYQAALQSAEANLKRQQANLAALQVKAKRYQTLVGTNAVSKQELDDILAQVALAEADVAAAQAAVNSNKINLDFAVVRAPISGQASSSQVTAGALVTANQANAMVTIHQLDPLYVDITQSSAEMLKLRAQLSSGQMSKDGSTAIELTLPDGSVYPIKARLQFSNASVDESTGSVTLRAVVANPDRVLLPNMYIVAKVPQGTLANAMLIPQQALTRTPQGEASVLVVDPNNTVRQQVVQAAFTQGDQWVVTDGLKNGDKLIIQGSQKIRMMPGMPAPTVKPILASDVQAAAPTTPPAQKAS
jgi:membrane fusion protein (multidrug efflux system)